MKKFFAFVCALFIVASASAQYYQVGEVVNINGKPGVVFFVSSGGQHGKIVSVAQTHCPWSEGKSWCSQLGRGWRLPTRDELMTIYYNRDAINAACNNMGYDPLVRDNYWSSEVHQAYSNVTLVWRFNMNTNSANADNSLKHDFVRAVYAF